MEVKLYQAIKAVIKQIINTTILKEKELGLDSKEELKQIVKTKFFTIDKSQISEKIEKELSVARENFDEIFNDAYEEVKYDKMTIQQKANLYNEKIEDAKNKEKSQNMEELKVIPIYDRREGEVPPRRKRDEQER